MNCHLQAPTSAKREKHRRTHDEMHEILLPRCATYKEGPQKSENGRAAQDAPEDKDQGPHVSLPGKVEPGKLHLGFGISSALYLYGYNTFGVHIRVLLVGEFQLSYSFVLIRSRVHHTFS